MQNALTGIRFTSEQAIKNWLDSFLAAKLAQFFYGEKSLTERQCQNWFARFRSGDFDLKNALSNYHIHN